jgi:hypothetical protein
MERRFLLRVCILLVLACISSGETYTYVDLIRKMADLEGLAVLPQPGEDAAQWSSYDRNSRYENGQYFDWGANGDGGGFIRTENGEQVLAEMEGPGVIWRIWSALTGSGRVKIYLDGNTSPVVDLPFQDYFNNTQEPFARSALAYNVAQGDNLYMPIPYQTSCKITAVGDWGQYYHFTYATYPEGTVLPTFSRTLSPEEADALDSINAMFANLGDDPLAPRPSEETEQENVYLSPGDTVTVASILGERAVTALKVDVGDLGNLAQHKMREVLLRIYWDDETSPSVLVPLGDFFGTAPGINTYKSLPMGMTNEGLYSYWYMPFSQKAQIDMINDGNSACSLQVSIIHAPLSLPADTLGRFHAKWHRDAFLPVEPERENDWTFLVTQGRGRFSGVSLHVWHPAGGQYNNPKYPNTQWWWGEGDEKFFVDGEPFPSTFGTGTEDYFGYAWCNSTLFQRAYHNQTLAPRSEFQCQTGDRSGGGHIANNRWHIGDNIPFQTGFEGALEKFFSNDKPVLYASTVYWYLSANGTDPYQSEHVTLDERMDYFLPPAGIIEGEHLFVKRNTGGTVFNQDMSSFGNSWSGDQHLWWMDASPSDTLVLDVPVRVHATYDLSAHFTKAVDYGVFQLFLDDEPLGEPLDLYNQGVIGSGELELGTGELTIGMHELKVVITGTNPNADPRHMFGLDYIKLELISAAVGDSKKPAQSIEKISVRAVNGTVFIRLTDPNTSADICIYKINGKATALFNGVKGGEVAWDYSGFPPGIYPIIIKSAGCEYSSKIVLQ